MKTLPKTVRPYKRTPTFEETTVPAGLLREHGTKAGVWGVINVLSGALEYIIPSTGEAITLDPDTPGIIEPETIHRVKPLGPVSFHVEFHR